MDLGEAVEQYAGPAIPCEGSAEKVAATTAEMLPVERDAALRVMGLALGRPISLDFLRMRTAEGWPRFAVFSLKDPVCWFEASLAWDISALWSKHTLRDYDERRESNVRPLSLYARFFKDVHRSLAAKCFEVKASRGCRGKEVVARIAQRWVGALPASARAKAKVATGVFKKDQILLVAEAGPWSLTEEVLSPKADPLLVAYDENAGAFLLDAFDLTSAEDMVRREFTSD